MLETKIIEYNTICKYIYIYVFMAVQNFQRHHTLHFTFFWRPVLDKTSAATPFLPSKARLGEKLRINFTAWKLMLASMGQGRSATNQLSLFRFLDVSKNRGISPQIIHFNRVFHSKPSILGYPYFWKHPICGLASVKKLWSTGFPSDPVVMSSPTTEAAHLMEWMTSGSSSLDVWQSHPGTGGQGEWFSPWQDTDTQDKQHERVVFCLFPPVKVQWIQVFNMFTFQELQTE